MDQESIQTAMWTRSHLGPDNRVYAYRTDLLLLNSYGAACCEHTIGSSGYCTSLLCYRVSRVGRSILQAARVRYLIVDLRLSTALPTKGYYFEGNQKPDRNITTPISVQALKKFDTIDGVKRILDSGNIVIYDVGELINAEKKP